MLEILAGPLKGRTLSLKRSSSIGRKGTDVELEDSKMSQIHAFFQFSPPETWHIVDNNSRNGIWVNGHREKKVQIFDGLELQVGQTVLRCRLAKKEDNRLPSEFLKWLRSCAKKLRDDKCPLEEIKPSIQLRVVEGQQLGEKWVIFYGPRQVGHLNLDLCIFENEMPKDGFSIEAIDKEPHFFTNYDKLITVNNRRMKSKILVPGDTIEIGQTKILVEREDADEIHP